LPLEGVTAENRQACVDLITARIQDKLPPGGRGDRGVDVVQHAGQWYLAMFLGEEVALAQVEAALQGSKFSVPRDRLRLFGHAILEIDLGDAPLKKLLAELEALDHVTVEASKQKSDRLLVTLDMPYPAGDGATDRGAVGWDKFARCDFSFDQSTRNESPATPQVLPGYEAMAKLLAQHDAELKDIRWSDHYACRALGCVVAPASDAAVSAKASTAPTKGK
jgi:hypothetical protein